MSYFDGKVAVITGAGSGIGRALAVELSRQGAHLALLDQDSAALAETARRCELPGVRVVTQTVDVTDWGSMQAAAGTVAKELGGAGAVFAVAGIIHRGSVLESEVSDIELVMSVNWLGVVHTVKAFLAQVIASTDGRIVTFSSAFGLAAISKYSAYNSSKFAVRAFSESLRQEMSLSRHRVPVTCVYPGGVRTPIVRNGLFAASENPEAVTKSFETRIARMTPEQAAAIVLKGVERGRARVFVGSDARLVAALVRVVGGHYQDLVPKLVRLLRRRTPSGRS
ncbi:SDR family NAD(P)-dependent oxidoreductase [Saccharothrix variisporea]|uniref:Short-subunit dehydrogenase n=1 Tax=Saccharothrix variisporea TaxID=543527 RepID=A0A495X5Y4_9PSEU|nr:SDR family NAD(P)-dependent oxidoreductase [Saccharothrix variisporea]RKT69392.1 short-subunit dehydrogenase [Saccharothrix variisporea]